MKAGSERRKDETGRELVPAPRSFILHPSSFILLTAALLLSGCGFQLRGTASLPFDTVYIQAPPTSQFAIHLKRVIASGSKTRVVERAADAQVLLHVQNEQREKQVLSLSGGGRVREYLLQIGRASCRESV